MLKDEDLLELLLAQCQQGDYAPRCDVIRPGDPSDTLYYVVEGSLSVQVRDDSGQAFVLAYLHQGDFLGELGVFLDTPVRNVHVKTRTESKLAKIHYVRLQELLQGELALRRADYLRMFGEHLARRLMRAERKTGDLALLDVTGRIARVLLDLAEQPDAYTHAEGVRVNVTRTEIARLSACSREMAGRCLRELEARQLIVSEGRSILVKGAGKATALLEDV